MTTTNLIVRDEKKYIKIEETLQNIYDLFVERTAQSLFQTTALECKDYAEMCRYEAGKHMTTIFGIGWKTAGNVLSQMSRGDMASAKKTIQRCMM